MAALALLALVACESGDVPAGLTPEAESAKKGPPAATAPASPAIVYMEGDALRVMNEDGSNATTIFQQSLENGTIDNAVWTPEGDAIAFRRTLNGAREIVALPVYLVDGKISTGEATILVDQGRQPMAFALDPTNGERVAYNRDGDAGVIRLYHPSAAEDPVLYSAPTDPAHHVNHLAWSHDGAHLAFLETNSEAYPYPWGSWAYSLKLVAVATGDTLLLRAENDSIARFPDWARNASVLIYSVQDAYDGKAPEYLRRHAIESGGGTVELLDLRGYQASWSPDDSRIAYTVRARSGTAGIALYDFLDGTVTTLSSKGTHPDWRRCGGMASTPLCPTSQ